MDQTSHGTEFVTKGKLKGTTDTDYFYFLCPTCKEIMAVTDFFVYTWNKSIEDVYFEPRKKVVPIKKPVRVTFELYCIKCKHKDYVKVSNVGWLGGKFE